MVCDKVVCHKDMCEDAEAEDAGQEAGGTDLKTRTPHNIVGNTTQPSIHHFSLTQNTKQVALDLILTKSNKRYSSKQRDCTLGWHPGGSEVQIYVQILLPGIWNTREMEQSSCKAIVELET